MGQTVSIGPRAQEVARSALAITPPLPPYLSRATESTEGRLVARPERDEIPLPVPIDERLIVELMT